VDIATICLLELECYITVQVGYCLTSVSGELLLIFGLLVPYDEFRMPDGKMSLFCYVAEQECLSTIQSSMHGGYSGLKYITNDTP
jgi:hypothetical protein